MSGSLTLEQKVKEHKTLITLKGKIDESADFSSASFKGIRVAIFDFAGIRMINSMGIQVWIAFLKRVPRQTAVIFKRCPLRVINQINLFPAFLAGRKVRITSFYAPWFCDQCDESFSFLLTTKDHFPEGKPLTVPDQTCQKCGEDMEFGVIEEKYLLFLKRDREAA